MPYKIVYYLFLFAYFETTAFIILSLFKSEVAYKDLRSLGLSTGWNYLQGDKARKYSYTQLFVVTFLFGILLYLIGIANHFSYENILFAIIIVIATIVGIVHYFWRLNGYKNRSYK